MGFFDILGGKERTFKKHCARAVNKRAQNVDRWQSLQFLGNHQSREAAEVLLKRFTFRVDPSITDQEEKELAMVGILEAGKDAVEPICDFLKQHDAIAWPIRMLQKLVSPDELVGVLLELLEGMETDYERDPQKKIDIIMQLEGHEDPRIRPEVERFLEDANENVRFYTVSVIFAQEDADKSRAKLLETLIAEEGVRVRVNILDGFIKNGWELGERAKDVLPQLPSGYALDGELVRKKG